MDHCGLCSNLSVRPSVTIVPGLGRNPFFIMGTAAAKGVNLGITKRLNLNRGDVNVCD